MTKLAQSSGTCRFSQLESRRIVGTSHRALGRGDKTALNRFTSCQSQEPCASPSVRDQSLATALGPRARAERRRWGDAHGRSCHRYDPSDALARCRCGHCADQEQNEEGTALAGVSGRPPHRFPLAAARRLENFAAAPSIDENDQNSPGPRALVTASAVRIRGECSRAT